jgi:ligand-binding sensor domain-containing protein/signal transduction histidine kinase
MDRTSTTCWSLFLAVLASLPAISWGAAPQPLPQDLTVRVWNKQQGLPDDSVTSVLQTSDGYLWVGTSSGLVRFDGVRFVAMAPRSSKAKTPIFVTALCEDSAGKLWIGTQGDGLLCREDGIVKAVPGSRASRDPTINSIAEDTTGNLWLGTPLGLIRLKGENLTRFTVKDGLPNDFVSNVHVARSGTVWITTRGGMCQFKEGRIDPFPFQTDSPGRNPESLGVYEDRRGQLWAFGDTYLVNLTEGKHLNHFGSGQATASTRIWSLCEGKHGELWIGTSGKGLYCFVDEKFIPLTLRNGDLASDVRALCEDREGNLWLGTHGDGLVRLQPRNVHVLDAAMGLPNRPAVCLAFNSQGHAWIGFERAGLYEGTAESFERIGGESGPELQNLVSSICIAPDSSLWLGSPGEGLYCITKQRTMHYTTADGLSDNSVLSLGLDSEGAVWAGTLGGLNRIAGGIIASYGTGSDLPDSPATAILAAHSGGVWIGFESGEVFREEHGAFRCAAESTVSVGKAVRALHEDGAGRLWFGTAGGRLGCVAGSRLLTWDLNPASADKSILGILGNEEGDLWLGTERSVYWLSQRDIQTWLSDTVSPRPQLVFKAESVSSAAPAYGWPRALKSPDGKLWFGMDSGAVTLDVRGPLEDSAPPPILIEEIAVNGQRLGQPQAKARNPAARVSAPQVRLSSHLRSLEIQFTALNFSNPEKVRFRHRLDGFDPDWVVDGESGRSVHYGRLPYGAYTFRVQAGNADQAWYENGASFSFLIPTPVWRTSWALAAYGLTTVMLAAGVVRLISVRRFRRRLATLAAQQVMERERMRIAQDMHDEIGSKLTKISFMSERAKSELLGQEPVARKLDSIAGTSRDLLQTLDEIVWAVNPHNDTLEHLADYLGQYATEYLQNTAVECELHIPRDLPNHALSAEIRHNLFLAFEESLNNALKHGRASRVRVDMLAQPSRFEIRIKDNGCGFDVGAMFSAPQGAGPAPGRDRNGLRNLRQRLALAGGHCGIESRPGEGTTVSLSIPLGAANGLKPNRSEA